MKEEGVGYFVGTVIAVMLYALIVLAPFFMAAWLVNEISDTRLGHGIQYWLEPAEEER